MRSGAPHALANRQRVGRAGSYDRDMPLALLPTGPWPLPLSQVRFIALSLRHCSRKPAGQRDSVGFCADAAPPRSCRAQIGRGDKSERGIVSLPPLPGHAPSPSAISGS